MNKLYPLSTSVSNQKHVLIIAYHILPYTKLWGAAQRMHYLAEHLIENKYSVTIVGANFGTALNSGKKQNYESICVDIKPRIIQQYQESFQKNFVSSSLEETQNNLWNLRRIIKKILKPIYLLFEKFFFNDFANYGFMCYFWEKQARRIIFEQISLKNIKTVIISGPYFGAFKLSKLLKKEDDGIKLILDYRDPWNLLKNGSKISLMKEKKYLSLADKIVMFSDKFKKDMMKTFSLPKDKCVTVYNGFDEDLWDKIVEERTQCKNVNLKERFVISYVSSNISFKKGTPRDPRNLIRAVSMMDNAENIILNIVGCIDYPNNNEINENLISINLLPFIQHEDALKIMQRSDVLVILSTETKTSKYTLTGKLFDCIRSGCFVLGIANSEDINYRSLIKELNIGAGCNNNTEEIFKILQHQYNNWTLGASNSASDFDKNIYSRRNQNMKLITFINSLNNK